MEKVRLNLSLMATQMRGCTALVRNMGPVDIESIACESGEAECIFSVLDELQAALMFCNVGPKHESDLSEEQRV